MSILAIAGMVLVLEGVLPFIAPAMWRETMQRIAQMQDGQIRFICLLRQGCPLRSLQSIPAMFL